MHVYLHVDVCVGGVGCIFLLVFSLLRHRSPTRACGVCLLRVEKSFVACIHIIRRRVPSQRKRKPYFAFIYTPGVDPILSIGQKLLKRRPTRLCRRCLCASNPCHMGSLVVCLGGAFSFCTAQNIPHKRMFLFLCLLSRAK